MHEAPCCVSPSTGAPSRASARTVELFDTHGQRPRPSARLTKGAQFGTGRAA